MKKSIKAFVAIAMSLVCLTACGGTPSVTDTPASTSVSASVEPVASVEKEPVASTETPAVSTEPEVPTVETPFADAVVLTEEIFDYYCEADWQKAYGKFLREIEPTEFELEYNHLRYYTLYDIDKDNVPELIVINGTYEADYVASVYCYSDGNVVLGGSFSYGHSSLYSFPEDNGLLLVYGQMGYMFGMRVLKDGTNVYLYDDNVFEDNMNERAENYPDESYIPVDKFIPGATILDMMPVSYQYGILAYNGPIQTMGEYLPIGTMIDMVEDALNDRLIFYGVNAEPYYITDVDTNGETSYSAFVKKIFSDGMGDPILLSVDYFDLNSDGQIEGIAVLNPVGEFVTYALVFSYQNGRLYCYASSYNFNADMELLNGHIYYSGEYAQGKEIYFDFFLDQADVRRADTGYITFSSEGKMSLELQRQDLRGDDFVLGAVYLGASGYYNETYLWDLLNAARETYADEIFMTELDRVHYVTTPGCEVYLLNPAREDYCVSVYENSYNENTEEFERGTLLYAGAPGEMFILRANISDIVPNTQVVIDANGKEYIFYPSLSLNDGTLCEDEGICDLTRYG